MPSQKNNPSADANQSFSDPLFNLHHAEAEAELARQNPTEMTARGLSANDMAVQGDDDATSDGAVGPVDSQGQRRGQQPSTPEMGSGAGHH